MWKKLSSDKKIKIDTIIASSTHIEGNLFTDSPMKVDGHIKGNITSTADIIIGEDAVITGDITAKDIIINGVVNGNAVSCETVTLTENGKINGDIKTTGLIVDNGCQFRGNCTIIDEVEAADTSLRIEGQMPKSELGTELTTDATNSE